VATGLAAGLAAGLVGRLDGPAVAAGPGPEVSTRNRRVWTVRYEHSVRIDATAEAVWAVWVDVERWPEWTASMASVRRLDSGPLGVGSRAKVKQPKLPATVWQVTEMEPDRSFVWVASNPGVRTTASHRVTPGSAGAGPVTATLFLEQAGPLARVVDLLLGGLTRRYLRMEADGLKARAERG
jgi:uncharacterized membrane protein